MRKCTVRYPNTCIQCVVNPSETGRSRSDAHPSLPLPVKAKEARISPCLVAESIVHQNAPQNVPLAAQNKRGGRSGKVFWEFTIPKAGIIIPTAGYCFLDLSCRFPLHVGYPVGNQAFNPRNSHWAIRPKHGILPSLHGKLSQTSRTHTRYIEDT